MKFKYKDQVVTASSKKDAIKKIVGYYNYLNDEFLEGFLRTALEVGGVRTKDMNEEDESDTENYSVKDFNTATINKAKKICNKFKTAMKAELNEAYNKGKTKAVAGACLYVTSGGFANGFMEKGFPKAKELDLEANKPAYAGFENLTLSKNEKIVTASIKVEAVKKIVEYNKKDNDLLHQAFISINETIYSDHEDIIMHLSDGKYPAKPHQKFETEIIKKAIDDAKEKAKKSISLFKEYTGYAGRIGSLGWEIIKKHPIVMFNKNSTIPKDLRRALQEYITAEEKAVVLIGRRGNELELDHK